LSGLDLVELELELRALLDKSGLTAPEIRKLWALGFSDLLDNIGGARRLVHEAVARVRHRQMG
jgi:hypothetical protein